MRRVALVASLMAFYAVLSGQFGSVYLMTCGAVGCVVVTLLAGHLEIIDDEGVPVEYWLRTALYAPWLAWQVLRANIDVAILVWSPKLRISPRMICLRHRLKTGYGIATYVNSITLTPGTVTVDEDEDELLVHALTVEAAEGLLTGEMHERILRVEGSE